MASCVATEATAVEAVTTRVVAALAASSWLCSAMETSNLATPSREVGELSCTVAIQHCRFCDVTAAGGSGSEAGGPGVTYFNGDGGSYSNLRVDNKCQLPEVTLPTSYFADADDYDSMLETGAITRLIAPSDDHVFEFSIVEIYGGAHLAFTANSSVSATMVVGDDTGKIIMGPGQTLDINGVS